MHVKVVENILKMNDELAMMNRGRLRDAGVFTVNLIGAPGCGKTALIEATIQRLAGKLRVGVIVGDLATQRDALRMARYTEQIVQVNTGKTCHLEAHHIMESLDEIELTRLDLLFIENVGNLICPVGFDLGQDLKVGMFAVSDGDDKAAKHPYLVTEAPILLLGKVDLLPHVPFDLQLFRDDVHRLHPQARLIEISAMTARGMDAWADLLLTCVAGD